MKGLILGLAVFALTTSALDANASVQLRQEAKVLCYNDDSQDSINQDALTSSTPGLFPLIPDPIDCPKLESVQIDDDGNVLLLKKKVYSADRDGPAIEVKVAPNYTLGILTGRGSLYLYRKSTLIQWFKGEVSGAQEFKMARNGNLVAVNERGVLISENKDTERKGELNRETGSTVAKIFAGRSGKVAALMEDGSVVVFYALVHDGKFDPAQKLKISASGAVVWLTSRGNILSLKREPIYKAGSDPAVSFKVNTAGRVAFLTLRGNLKRDDVVLYENSGININTYQIQTDGAVNAVDMNGRKLIFK